MADEEPVETSEPKAEETNEESGPEQTVTVEDIGPARKSLTIEIPATRIAEKINDSFSKLGSDADIPGFRRGRAPRRLVERRFGTGVREDVRGQLISDSFAQAVEDQKLEVIGEPDIKDLDQLQLPETGPLTFKVEVEVSPEVQLPELDGIEVKRPMAAVTDEKINEEVDRIRDRLGTMVELNDAKVEEGDSLMADVRIQAGMNAGDDADEIADHVETRIPVNGERHDYVGHVAGIFVKDLGKQLIGKGVGDQLAISMTGPAAHENERIKDQPITIKILINRVERLEPGSIQTLATQLGVETPEEVHSSVGRLLEQRREHEQQISMREDVCTYLTEKVKLELPEQLSSRQATRSLQRQAVELMYRGVPEHEITQRLAEFREDNEQQSKKQLRLFFILEKAAKALEIEVSEAEINGRIAMMATQQNRRPEKLRQQMQRTGQLNNLYLQLREQKTLDKILEKATITEESAGSAQTEKPSPAGGMRDEG